MTGGWAGSGGDWLPEPMRQAGLFHDFIGGVAGLQAVIDGKFFSRMRAVPDFMVAFALPEEGAAIGS